MNKRFQSILLVLIPILALIAGIIYHQANQKPENLTAFSLPDLAGKQHNIFEWQGKTLVINLWATWCPSCREEIPEFIKLQNEYQVKNVQFIGIAINKPAEVANYLKTVNINYPILIAEKNGHELAKQLGNSFDALPFTLVVNKHGQIIYQGVGGFSKEELEQVLKQPE